jgi:hypothetical protein
MQTFPAGFPVAPCPNPRGRVQERVDGRCRQKLRGAMKSTRNLY